MGPLLFHLVQWSQSQPTGQIQPTNPLCLCMAIGELQIHKGKMGMMLIKC